jgi:hypothetical protein
LRLGRIVPDSGHDISLAVNHQLQVADAVAWSSAFVGQRDLDDKRNFDEKRNFEQSDRGLTWNNGLPWNCGGISAESK